VAIDTETMVSTQSRPSLCGAAFARRRFGRCGADRGRADQGANIEKLLANKSIVKIFHFARFDLGMMAKAFGVMAEPVYCTRSLRVWCALYRQAWPQGFDARVLGIDLSKQQQSSTGAPTR